MVETSPLLLICLYLILTIRAQKSLNISSKIYRGGYTIKLISGNETILGPNFEISLGSILEITPDPCVQNY